MENNYGTMLRAVHDDEALGISNPKDKRTAATAKIDDRVRFITLPLVGIMQEERYLLEQLAVTASDIINIYGLKDECPAAYDALILNLEKMFAQGVSKLCPDIDAARRMALLSMFGSTYMGIFRRGIYSFCYAISDICYEIVEQSGNDHGLELDLLLDADEIHTRIQKVAKDYKIPFYGFI